MMKRFRLRRASVSKTRPAAIAMPAERRAWIALIMFLGIVALTGGASRSDVLSLVLLRPAAVLFAAAGVLLLPAERFRRNVAPLLFVSAAMALVASQLIPVPFDWWSGLPGRSDYADALTALSVRPDWLPVTLSPSRTVNALAALAVPLAAVLLVTAQSQSHHRRVAIALLVIAGASAVLGLLQQFGNPRGPLYLYNVTNWGAPVGLFANRNHQAVFLAAVAPFAIAILLAGKARDTLAKGLASGFLALAFIVVMLSGSRAGLVCAAVAGGAGIYRLWSVKPSPARSTDKRPNARTVKLLAASALFLLLPLSLILGGRDLALQRFSGTEALEEDRFHLIPTLWQMIVDFFPIGSGAGTFELAFYRFETTDMLDRYYFNQAHNDWLQPLIEGGLAAALLGTAFVLWAVRAVYRAYAAKSSDEGASIRWAAATAIVVFGIASVFDYPLRTPLAATVFVTCCVLVGQRTKR